MYPRISKFFLKYSYASHLTHVPDHSSSYRLMLLNAEFPAGLWTKKHHSTSKIIQKNASVLFWSGSTDSDCLDFASLASAALRDFHRCVCPISGRRRERFLSETSRASNPNSSSRVLVDFLEVSHFHKGKL